MDTLTPSSTREAAVGPPVAARMAVATLFLINGMLFGTWVSRIPAIELERGLSHGALGLALLAMAAAALIAMPLGGRFGAIHGSHRVCQLFTLTYAFLLPVLAIAPGVACFVAAIFCFGAGHGSLDIAMNAQAVMVEKRYRRPIMSSFHALFSAGGLTGAAVGGLVASAGVRPSVHFAAVSIVAAVAGLLAFRHLLDDRAEATHGDAGTVAFRLPSRGLIAVGALAFCAMVGEGAMADWSGIFLREHLGAAAGVAALGYAAFSIAMTAMRFLGDWLCGRIGPRGLVRLSGILAAGGMGMVLLAPSSIGVIAGFACTGAGFATVVPLAFSAAGRTPGIPAGIALSTVTTVGYLGFLIGPPLIGFAAEVVGLRLALVAIFITSALIGLLAPAAGGRKAAPERSSRRPLVPYLVGSAG